MCVCVCVFVCEIVARRLPLLHCSTPQAAGEKQGGRGLPEAYFGRAAGEGVCDMTHPYLDVCLCDCVFVYV